MSFTFVIQKSKRNEIAIFKNNDYYWTFWEFQFVIGLERVV